MTAHIRASRGVDEEDKEGYMQTVCMPLGFVPSKGDPGDDLLEVEKASRGKLLPIWEHSV
jgi:hypothetical protein